MKAASCHPRTSRQMGLFSEADERSWYDDVVRWSKLHGKISSIVILPLKFSVFSINGMGIITFIHAGATIPLLFGNKLMAHSTHSHCYRHPASLKKHSWLKRTQGAEKQMGLGWMLVSVAFVLGTVFSAVLWNGFVFYEDTRGFAIQIPRALGLFNTSQPGLVMIVINLVLVVNTPSFGPLNLWHMASHVTWSRASPGPAVLRQSWE